MPRSGLGPRRRLSAPTLFFTCSRERACRPILAQRMKVSPSCPYLYRISFYIPLFLSSLHVSSSLGTSHHLVFTLCLPVCAAHSNFPPSLHHILIFHLLCDAPLLIVPFAKNQKDTMVTGPRTSTELTLCLVTILLSITSSKALTLWESW